MREIVIKIPNKVYKAICNKNELGCVFVHIDDIKNIIRNGTPLPKGCDVQRFIPKKVNIQKWTHTKCPNLNCNCELSTHHCDGYYFFKHKPDFCHNCGQALLWESEV